MSRVVALIRESAKDWKVTPRVAWWIFWLPILGAILVAAARVNRHFYDLLTKEDGPIEWAQFVCYAGASLVGFGVAIKRFQAGHKWQSLLFLGFALASFFIAGEEIAWGQRIFGLQTPEELREINHQGEITVHNIRIIQDTFNVVLFLAGVFGMGSYFANRKYHFERRWDQANYLFVPPLFNISCYFILFSYKLLRFVFLRDSEFTITRYAEWPELCLAFALFLFVWLNYRRLAAQQKPAIAPAETGLKRAK